MRVFLNSLLKHVGLQIVTCNQDDTGKLIGYGIVLLSGLPKQR